MSRVLAIAPALWLLAAGCMPSAEQDLRDDPRPSSAGGEAPALAAELPAAPRKVLEPVGDAEPGTKAAGKVLGVLERVEETLVTTKYQHSTKVREKAGHFAWDCSGMAAWVLERAAPKALAAMASERPVARDFFRAIERAPTDKAKRGWRRLGGVVDARPGDVFAWLRPPDLPRDITGHVGFVVETPRPVEGLPGAYVVRIADATRLPHGEDTRLMGGDGGYGTGDLLVLTDDSGVATHYGWFGLESRGFMETTVLFGRVSK